MSPTFDEKAEHSGEVVLRLLCGQCNARVGRIVRDQRGNVAMVVNGRRDRAKLIHGLTLWTKAIDRQDGEALGEALSRVGRDVPAPSDPEWETVTVRLSIDLTKIAPSEVAAVRGPDGVLVDDFSLRQWPPGYVGVGRSESRYPGPTAGASVILGRRIGLISGVSTPLDRCSVLRCGRAERTTKLHAGSDDETSTVRQGAHESVIYLAFFHFFRTKPHGFHRCPYQLGQYRKPFRQNGTRTSSP